jgi:glycosyltransferase involved in cell wall biosynthesis
MSISVCMATYNGELYVGAQLRSILDQLGDEDEVIVIDDCSTDRTVDVVNGFADPRILLRRNERNLGEVISFSRALEQATNEYVFLADQDDIWIPGRADRMIACLKDTGASLVTGNFVWMDTNEVPIDIPYDGVASSNSSRHFGNVADIFIGKTNYFGCAMVLRRPFVKVVAPIPWFVESHDLWIALASNVLRSNAHLDDATLRKRKHGHNATSTVSSRSLPRKLWSRVLFAMSLVAILGRWRHFSRPSPISVRSGESLAKRHVG